MPVAPDSNDVDDAVGYSLIQNFPTIQYSVITAALWEGNDYLLLNTKTGKTTNIDGEAALSPDGRRLLVWSNGIESAYSSNVLEIYYLTKKGLILEYQARPTEWGPADVAWIAPNTILFSKRFFEANEIKSIPKSLRFAGKSLNRFGTWETE